MKITEIPSQCPQCGAPLTRKGEYIICEFCGQNYWISDSGKKLEPENKTRSTENLQQVKPQPKPPLYQKQRKPETKPVKAEILRNINRETKYAIIVIIILFILGSAYSILTGVQNKTDSSQANKNKGILLQQIISDTYNKSVEYPADSIENTSISSVMLMIDAQPDDLIFNYYIQNNSGRELDTNLKTEHVEIASLSVSNNLEESYTCTYEKLQSGIPVLKPGEVRHLGLIKCEGNLNKEVTAIDIDIENPNWGNSHYQIPLTFDSSDLMPDSRLTLNQNEKYTIDVDLLSEKPQVARIRAKDISISDDMGNDYSLDNCLPLPMQDEEGDYYAMLTKNYEHFNIYNRHELISCEYNEPLPLDVDSMTISMKIGEEIYISTAVIDRLDGKIDFTNQAPY